MTDICEIALEILADVLEPEYPEAATFLKPEEGRDGYHLCMQANEYCRDDYDIGYRGAVLALWGKQSDFLEAGDFLNTRKVRAAYYGRVQEKRRKADREAERAERDVADRRARFKEKLDRLVRDGVLSADEREELDRDRDSLPI